MTFDEQINLRVPGWLKDALEQRARERAGNGPPVKPAAIAREILWEEFSESAPREDAEVKEHT